MNIHYQYFQTPVGEMILASFNGKLCLADWRYRKQRDRVDNRLKKYFNADFIERDDAVIKEARLQLQEYFLAERKQFDLPLVFAGTEFQQSVWRVLQTIAYGETASYSTLAQKLGDSKLVRAVANANGANGMSIIVPCHRIIGRDGSLVGYAGGLSAKQRLLGLEASMFADLL